MQLAQKTIGGDDAVAARSSHRAELHAAALHHDGVRQAGGGFWLVQIMSLSVVVSEGLSVPPTFFLKKLFE